MGVGGGSDSPERPGLLSESEPAWNVEKRQMRKETPPTKEAFLTRGENFCPGQSLTLEMSLGRKGRVAQPMIPSPFCPSSLRGEQKAEGAGRMSAYPEENFLCGVL